MYLVIDLLSTLENYLVCFSRCYKVCSKARRHHNCYAAASKCLSNNNVKIFTLKLENGIVLNSCVSFAVVCIKWSSKIFFCFENNIRKLIIHEKKKMFLSQYLHLKPSTQTQLHTRMENSYFSIATRLITKVFKLWNIVQWDCKWNDEKFDFTPDSFIPILLYGFVKG